MTAGPTYEPIDPVRFIGNHSSGKMGFALAESLTSQGAEVILISGPASLRTSSENIKRIDVNTADEMFNATDNYFDKCDGAILSAAVADYKVRHQSAEKIKKTGEDSMSLELIKNKDILESLGKIKRPDQVLVGFSLETTNERENALSKLKKKKCDIIILNSLNDPGAGFTHDTNKVTILDKSGEETELPLKSKKEVADDIVNYMVKKYF